MSRPRLLDLFCGAGGSAVGYHRAGFEVVGVDVRPQPRYPFEFVQADALDFMSQYAPGASGLVPGPVQPAPFGKGHAFQAIHASPPCRDHTTLTSRVGLDGSAWMLDATRRLLEAAGLPYVIENVPGAPLRRDLTLCGGMFGLRTYRHRWFESNIFLLQPGHPPHVIKTSTKRRRACWDAGMHVSVTGDVGVYVGRLAMGIDWMTGEELSQAIPPSYTEFIGHALLAHLERAA